jgi:hypothetical protein
LSARLRTFSTMGDPAQMSAELTYDLMLEVTGVLRSIPVRAKLDSDLRVGEIFDLRGRRWIVSSVDQIGAEDFDRRVVAREVDEAQDAA